MTWKVEVPLLLLLIELIFKLKVGKYWLICLINLPHFISLNYSRRKDFSGQESSSFLSQKILRNIMTNSHLFISCWYNFVFLSKVSAGLQDSYSSLYNFSISTIVLICIKPVSLQTWSKICELWEALVQLWLSVPGQVRKTDMTKLPIPSFLART